MKVRCLQCGVLCWLAEVDGESYESEGNSYDPEGNSYEPELTSAPFGPGFELLMERNSELQSE